MNGEQRTVFQSSNGFPRSAARSQCCHKRGNFHVGFCGLFLNRGNLPGFDKNVEFLWIFRNSWKLGKRGYLNGKTNKIETVPWEKWWKNIIRR